MKKHLFGAVAIIVLAVLAVWGVYQWFFCRFYVPAGQMAIVTAKSGRTPEPGKLLVERGEKGIWREVLPEGRYFLDPVMHDIEIVSAISIPIGKVGVVTSKVGKPLAPGEIIAPDESYQGVWGKVLGPGIYRLNPQGYTVDLVDAINVPMGYAGVVTSQTGNPAPQGEFASAGEKGVLKDILQPGLYYINPRAYQVNVIEIGMNQVSMTGREGSMIEVKNKIESASDALKEMEFNTLNNQQQARVEYARQNFQANSAPAQMANNVKASPKRMKMNATSSMAREEYAAMAQDMDGDVAAPQKTAEQIYSLSNFVEFPSRDGFKILMDMTVEFELMPESVSQIYMLYGDLPQVVEKIILPQVLSVSRLKGSSYKAQDFIMGEGRETFQNNLRNELVGTMREKHIIIHNAIIRNVAIPDAILKPIQDASLAQEQNLTNFSLQETAKIEAELNTQTSMIEQKRQEVGQETAKIVAEIKANQQKAVRMVAAQTELEAAEIQLKRSEIEAKIEKLKGEVAVQAEFLVEDERVRGQIQKGNVLGPVFADMAMVDALNPDVKVNVIYAGDGTLWTDMKSGTVAIAPTPNVSTQK